jgi:hypothetical protein
MKLFCFLTNSRQRSFSKIILIRSSNSRINKYFFYAKITSFSLENTSKIVLTYPD